MPSQSADLADQFVLATAAGVRGSDVRNLHGPCENYELGCSSRLAYRDSLPSLP